MFEKHTNTFMCKAPGREMLRGKRNSELKQNPELQELSSLDQNLLPFIRYPNFCYLQTPNQGKYEEKLT